MKLGQMFLLGFDGSTVSEDHWIVQEIFQENLGGVILFDRNIDGSLQNISSPDQLKNLTSYLQAISDVPLLIAVDQEGGKVCRLKHEAGFTASESAAKLSKLGLKDVALFTSEMAKNLADHGINFNLAPVVDLDLNPNNPIISRYERSFGKDIGTVVACAKKFIKAHHEYGISCCLKHFPGHGSASSDSHLGFVDISAQWQEKELEPYRRLFSGGFSDAVMTAHVVHKYLEPSLLPATLSPAIINTMLREELGFNGVTMTDDLQMKAISDHYGFREAVQMAVLAGVDLLVIGNNLLRQGNVLAEGIAAIEELLKKGKIDMQSLEGSLQRINELKQKIQGKILW